MIHQSVITCPHCEIAKSEAMPTDACHFFYECTGCGARLRPKFLRLGAVSADPGRACRRERRGFLLYGLIWHGK